MPPPAEERERAGDIRIFIITGLFFVVVFTGGSLLVTYVTLPPSKATARLAIAGVVLIAVPWVFWILMFVYRFMVDRISGGGDGPGMPSRSASIAPDPNFGEGGGSPGGTRTGEGGGGGDGAAAGGNVGGRAAEEVENSSSAVSVDEGASLNSHESERPLAFS